MKKVFTISFLTLWIILISGCSLIEQKSVDNWNINQEITDLKKQISDYSSQVDILKTNNKELQKENRNLQNKISTNKEFYEEIINQYKNKLEELENEKESNNQNIQNNDKDKNNIENKNSSLIEYSDKELWISFSYPKNWGKIYKDYDSPWPEWIDFATLSIWDDLFLCFSNWKPSAWRWAFWGDESRTINNQEYIMNYCDNQKIDKSKWEKCEMKKNKNGIYYIKSTKQYYIMWEENSELITTYKIYNSKSTFRWIIASNERFKNKIENDFDSIIENLSFMK